MPRKTKTLIRAGGGTGGHVFPIKSLIQYINSSTPKQKLRHYRLGTSGSLEEEVATQLNQQEQIKNLTFLPLLSGKFRREKTLSAFFRNIIDFFKFLMGFFQAFYYLIKVKADVVFCKGGYVALPVVLAARILRKKIIVHESDTHAGLVNRIAAKFANTVFTGFDEVLPWAKTVGQILSDELIESSTLHHSEQTEILVMGWSQGSQEIYLHLIALLQQHEELALPHFTILLGKLNQELGEKFAPFPNVTVIDFASQKEIGQLYDTADAVITRGGTTALAEQELFDLKMIIIPIPRTHDQKENALWYVKHHQASMLDQEEKDFAQHLYLELLSLSQYKKKWTKRDRKAEIHHAKAIITEKILKS